MQEFRSAQKRVVSFRHPPGGAAVAFTCRAVISGAEENVGGTMQILSPTSQLLVSIPIKK